MSDIWKESIHKDFIDLIENKTPGAAYAIIKNGEVVDVHYEGVGQIDKNIAIDKTSKFRIASMTKSLTCMAILHLKEAGKLDLDTPASEYVPQMRRWQYPVEDAPQITVRDLMSHMSGFPEDNLWGDRHLDWKMEEMLDFLQKGIAFSSIPETQFEYSNLGFGILGQIIVNIAHQSYQSYITENVILPLGMKNTYWEIDDVPADQLVKGYRLVKDQFQEEPILHDGAFGAMGGLITTIEDFAKYVTYHASAYKEDNAAKIVISKSSLREMHRPWAMDKIEISDNVQGKNGALAHGYGFGLFWMKDNNDNIYIGHSGSLPGYNSHWWLVPNHDLAIITFANAKYPKVAPFNYSTIQTLMQDATFPKLEPVVSDILLQRQKELLSFMPDFDKAQAANHIFTTHFFDDNIPAIFIPETQHYFELLGENRTISPMIPENLLRGDFVIEGNGHQLKIKLTLTPEKNARIQEVAYQFV